MAKFTEPARDFPFMEVAKECERRIADGGTIFQKFTCEHCGARLTMDEPDKLFTTGSCEECGKVTNIEKRGCNYTLIARVKAGNLKDIFGNGSTH